jgi:predicted nuclease of predicted toxin-antitoxin system
VRLLLDENISPIIGDALRAAGHDVHAVTLVRPGASDEDVAAFAISEGRIVVSEDKDFSSLALRRKLRLPGLVQVRLPGYVPALKAARLVKVLEREAADGLILVIEPARIRRRKLT